MAVSNLPTGSCGRYKPEANDQFPESEPATTHSLTLVVSTYQQSLRGSCDSVFREVDLRLADFWRVGGDAVTQVAGVAFRVSSSRGDAARHSTACGSRSLLADAAYISKSCREARFTLQGSKTHPVADGVPEKRRVGDVPADDYAATMRFFFDGPLPTRDAMDVPVADDDPVLLKMNRVLLCNNVSVLYDQSEQKAGTLRQAARSYESQSL
ncbi:hypothetical protein CPLU01_15139 [Colletotrichum plurivorum]|uniref:Uncharacterized protein n=1 Tax=Colletotrichum plurivorum TaxID=2175906 RepID=A0A8H6MWY5_9PEZI|nr:hypothetical protein CPLU01_15139 [Colletotrichum plurivorum]